MARPAPISAAPAAHRPATVERDAASGPGAPVAALALADIYRDHFDFVFRIAKRLGGAALDAEDVAQEVFVIVSRKLDTFDHATAQVTTWLYGITFNVVRAMRRRRRIEMLYRADESEGREVALVSIETAELQEAWRVANEILTAIAPKKRDVFILAEFEGLSCFEIGQIVGAKEETVWSRLHYARQEFAKRLAQRQLRP